MFTVVEYKSMQGFSIEINRWEFQTLQQARTFKAGLENLNPLGDYDIPEIW